MTSHHIGRRRHSPVLLLLLLLLSTTPFASGYASWLKCFIDLDDSEVIMNHNVVPFEEAIHKVQVQVKLDHEDNNSDWTTDSISYSDANPTKLRVKLRVPDELARLDVQYVVEASLGASFTTRSMCGGSRSHANNHDVENVLVIDGSQPSVQVWAGWATGHEPVYLTDKLTLYRQGDGASVNGGEL